MCLADGAVMPTSSDIKILARGEGTSGRQYLILRAGHGAQRRRRCVALDELRGEATMMSLDLVATAARSAFHRQVQDALPNLPVSIRVADRSGFVGDAFVWPDGAVSGRRVLTAPRIGANRVGEYRSAGSLRGWQRIAHLARGSSRVMLVLAHAFVGPVVDLLGGDAPMIQLAGAAGTFKSALLGVVAALWGCEARSWHGTPDGVEVVAACYNATHLVLDDLRPARGKRSEARVANYEQMRAALIRLADGRTKERFTLASERYRTPVVSAANRSLDGMAIAAGVELDVDQAALRGRMIDVPLVRAGLFEELHGRARPLALIVDLDAIASAHPGVAAAAVVLGLLEWRRRDADGLVGWLRARRREYADVAERRFGSRSEYDLVRPHMRMGTIYAAGCAAIRLGILPWSRSELGCAVLACEAAHLELYDTAVGGPESGGVAAALAGGLTTEPSPLDALRRHVRRRRGDLVDLRRGLVDDEQHDHEACPGYVHRHADGVLEVLFPEAVLRRVCGTDTRLRALKRELAAAGVLRRGGPRPSVKRMIFSARTSTHRPQVIAVRASAFKSARRAAG